MAFKFIAFATLVAAASAGLTPAAPQVYHVAHAAPIAYTHGAPLAYAAPVAKVLTKSHEPEPFDAHPQYSYSYDVHDTHTGDAKRQQETRNGDVVEGSYSFIEADGSRRIVHYTADDHNGFNAVVEKEPTKVAVKAVAPVAYHAAPVAKIAAPIAHATYVAAPVAHTTYEHAAPAYSQATYTAAAPVAHATYEHAAPAYSQATYTAAAPVAHASYEHAAPAYSQATYTAAAPVAHASYEHAAPAHAHSYYH